MEELIEFSYRKPDDKLIHQPIDLQSFNPKNGIMTRYGKKMLEEGAKYYGKLKCATYGTS